MAGLILIFALLSLHNYSFTAEDEKGSILTIEEGAIQFAGPFVYYLEDPDGAYSINDVRSMSSNDRFRPVESEVFNVLPTESAFWFKITVQNKSNQDLWLEVGDAFSTWYLDFYAPNSEGHYTHPIQLGALRPISNKLLSSNVYCVPLSTAENRKASTYYFRIETYFPETHIFKVGSMQQVQKDLKNRNYMVAGFIGIMLAMIIYNLFLLISLRQIVYLYYLSYLVLITIGATFSQGYPIINYSWMWHYFLTFQLFVALAVFLFTVTYLDLYRISRKMYWLLASLTALLVFAGILNVWIPHRFVDILNFVQPVLFINHLCIITVSILVWRKGHSKARFFVFGWAFAIAGILVFLLAINGALPINTFTSNTLFIGISLEAVMFALALADYMNILKQEKEQLQKHNLTLIQKQKSQLEDLVSEKTKELQHAYDESFALNAKLRSYNDTLNHQKKKLELTLHEKEEMQNQLVESEKMATLGVLAAGVAHEINNPLNFIKGGVEVLENILTQNTAVNPKDYKRLMRAIHVGISRAARIVTSLNEFSHVTNDPHTSCNVHRLIENCITMVRHELKKGINISLEYQFYEIFVDGDSGKLHQVFLNLLTNSIDAIDENGEIIIRTQADKGQAIIDFIDSGHGIKEDHLKKIFAPFFTTKNPGKGTGLGLAISYAVIKEHNGSLHFTSSWGQGTTARIQLPLTEAR